MKSNYLLHVLLLAILCVNQIAAQVHVAGHQVHVAGHTDSHKHLHDHSSEQAHNHLILEDSDSGNPEVDCAGFHAYVGLNGLVSIHCLNTVVQLKGNVKPSTYNFTIVAQATDSLKIRGPPSRS